MELNTNNVSDKELESFVKQSVDELFKNTAILIEYRKIIFECGDNAFSLIKKHFKDTFLKTMPIFFYDSSNALSYGNNEFELSQAFISGIGNCELNNNKDLQTDLLVIKKNDK